MKTLQTLIFILLANITIVVKANTGIKPIFKTNTISVLKIDASTIQINASLNIGKLETVIIERSYDNKNFQEVVLLMGNNNDNQQQQINVKNKIKLNAKKVYYRVVKINNSTTGTVIANTTISR